MKKQVDDLGDFDFGFSFTDDVIETKQQVKDLETAVMSEQDKIANLQQRISSLYNAIEPFLDNLCKNPEKSTIHWPNRVEKITQYKEKLKSIAEGN